MERINFNMRRSDIQLFGLRRSGIHGLADWAIGHFVFDRAIYNNVQLLPDGTMNVLQDHIDFIVGCNDSPIDDAVADPKWRLVIFEDHDLRFIERHLRRSMLRVLMLRDPYNMIASRLQIVRYIGQDPQKNEEDMTHLRCNNPELGIYLWKQYAKEFLGQTNYLRSDKCQVVKVNFNKWWSEEDYRKEISEKAGWDFTDEGFNSTEGWKFSRGSSFENVLPSKMQLDSRWKQFENDPEFRSFFDSEVHELCREIFGWDIELKTTQDDKPLDIIQTDALIHKAILTASEMMKQGQNEEAEIILLQSLKVNVPVPVELYCLLGIIQSNLGKLDEAIKTLQKGLDISDDAACHSNLALCYQQKNQSDLALKHAKKAVELNPDNPNFINNLGLQYYKFGKTESAESLFRKALNKMPDPHVMVNLASCLTEKRELADAKDYLETAISLAPDLHGAHVNLAYVLLLQGEWKEGYEHLEHRLYNYAQMRRYLEIFDSDKLWDGKESLDGKKVVVYGEQGFGDTIQYVRYLPKLKELGATVCVCCAPELVTLISGCEGADEVVMKGLHEGLVYDYHLPILSIPHLTQNFDISSEPYIINRKKPWDIHKVKGRDIGLCWRGSKIHPEDSKRSISLSQFYDLSSIVANGDCLWSLQKNHDEYADVKALKMADVMDTIEDFSDTASLIDSLDLVITVDTAILHLAGAMGKKVWALIPYKPDWRWGLDDDKTPWYKDVILFRQGKNEGWAEVIDRVCLALDKF